MRRSLIVLSFLVLCCSCSTVTREVEAERDVTIFSHFYFGAGWATLVVKETAYERDADPLTEE